VNSSAGLPSKSEGAYVDERGGVGIRLEPAARSCGSTVSNSAERLAEGRRAGRRNRPMLL
jgi:hypothetical protein